MLVDLLSSAGVMPVSAAAMPGSALPPPPEGLALKATVPNPRYANLTGLGIAAIVLTSILLMCSSVSF